MDQPLGVHSSPVSHAILRIARNKSGRIYPMTRVTHKLENRRVLPRFPLHSEQVKIHLESYERIFVLRDVSLSGMGIDILEHSDILLFPEKKIFQGKLHLQGDWFQVELKVERNGVASVGFSFQDPSDELRKRIEDFLDPILIGKSIKQISMENAPEAFGEGITSWYHGESNSDLYLCENAEGQPFRVLMTGNGLFLEWVNSEDLRTGELEHEQGSKVLLHYDANARHSTTYQGRKILENTPILDYRLVDLIWRNNGSELRLRICSRY